MNDTDEEPLEDELQRLLDEAVIAAELLPAVRYAARKLGFIVLPGERAKASRDRLEEWDAAVDEFFDR